MSSVNSFSAKQTLKVGGEEFENDKLRIKNMSTGEEETLPITEVEKITTMIRG